MYLSSHQLALKFIQVAILKSGFSCAAGLDIDALREVANAVNGLKSDRTATVMVTHYKRLLNYIKPDFVHVMEARSLPDLILSSTILLSALSPVKYPTPHRICMRMQLYVQGPEPAGVDRILLQLLSSMNLSSLGSQSGLS